MRVQLPGAAWAALITLLTGALSGWMNEWIEAPWVPMAIIGLSTAAKLVQLYVEIQQPTIRTYGEKRPSVLSRLLLG